MAKTLLFFMFKLATSSMKLQPCDEQKNHVNHRPFGLNDSYNLKNPSIYVQQLLGEFSPWAFDERRVLDMKGHWREYLNKNPDTPLDLEIGLGNGLHFAYRACKEPNRCLVGLEIKYKPLIQSIRRAKKAGCNNVLAARWHAHYLDHIFAESELDDVFIFFPDPWVTPRRPSRRILNPLVIEQLSHLQKPNGCIVFKTDNKEAFEWSLANIKQHSSYEIDYVTYDLHRSDKAATNFVTQFESIFIRQGLAIYYFEARRKSVHS